MAGGGGPHHDWWRRAAGGGILRRVRRAVSLQACRVGTPNAVLAVAPEHQLRACRPSIAGSWRGIGRGHVRGRLPSHAPGAHPARTRRAPGAHPARTRRTIWAVGACIWGASMARGLSPPPLPPPHDDHNHYNDEGSPPRRVGYRLARSEETGRRGGGWRARGRARHGRDHAVGGAGGRRGEPRGRLVSATRVGHPHHHDAHSLVRATARQATAQMRRWLIRRAFAVAFATHSAPYYQPHALSQRRA